MAYKCKICGKEFEKSYELAQHVRLEHPKPPSEKKPPAETKKEESLFEKPKSPDQILREVLEEHQVNPRFIEYAVNRAKRLGGLHPIELQKMLTDLKSGIETKAEAQYIVDDYYYALQQEQEKARRLGYHVSYPLSYRPEETPTPSYFYRPRQDTPQPYQHTDTFRYSPNPYPSQQPYSQPYQPYNQPVTLEQIAKLIDDKINNVLLKQEEERRLQELRKELTEQIELIRNEFKEQINSLMNTVSTKSEPQQPAETITKEDLLNFQKQMLETIEKKKLESILEAEKEKAKLLREAYEARLKGDAEKIDQLNKKIEELTKKVAEKPVVVSSEGYTRDEYRIIADAMNILGRKSPIRDLGQIVINLTPREQTARPERPTEKVEGKDITELLPDELIAEE